MRPVGQGTKRVLAAQFYLSVSLVGFTRVISFLLLLADLATCNSWLNSIIKSHAM